MKCSPKLNIEAVADSGNEQFFRTFRQIVEVLNVFGLEERNGYFDCIGIVRLRLLRNVFRLLGEKRFENVALDTASFQLNRIFATLVVDKPLSEVVFEMYLNENGVHSERLKDV